MKKIVSIVIVCVIAMMAYAVPAKREWQTRVQADGTTIEVQLMGDEFYHYFVNREGKQVREVDGQFKVIGEAPTAAKVQARRAATTARRQRKDVGTTPNLAPKGVVVLANFNDSKMNSAHTQAVFDELCNSLNCTVNNGYPSAAQYFADQSNGAYRPVFDVFGPVDLSRDVAYYGTDGSEEGDDQHATDAVVEACRLADQQFTINWADYDSNNDGKVDFVYVIYAGRGQADGGAAETIWPHNWSVESARYYGNCTYSAAQCKVGGKKLDNYAMSSELSGNDLGGIGTLCHEFGHVMGLPDFYDTAYGTNYDSQLTPNEWDVMDGGAYNGNGHCPPNYSPWEKYFFGWATPVNLGSEPASLTLYPNGTADYNTYQINESGTLESATKNGLSYYIECRQKQGWDAKAPAAGMVIWMVNFDASSWTSNTPNNTANAPKYTLVIPEGTKIGAKFGTKNVWPYSTKNSWDDVVGKPLKNIKKDGNNITLIYIEEPAPPVDPFDVQWYADGTLFETNQCTGYSKVVLPSAVPAACENRVFIGWCADATYESAVVAPTLVKAGDVVEEGAKFYAIFATQEGDGNPAVDDVLTLETTGVTGTSYSTWYGKTLASGATYAGNSAGGNDAIQLRTKNSNSGIVTTKSGGRLAKIAVEWNSNTSGRTLDIYGKNGAYSSATNLYETDAKGTKLGSIDSDTGSNELIIEGDYAYVGIRSNSGALFVNKIIITWGGNVTLSDYSTSSGCGGQGIEETLVERPAAVKVIRDGRIVIIRGEEEFTITGERIR